MRDAIRLLPDGELAWQRLQGQVYGKGIGGATMVAGRRGVPAPLPGRGLHGRGREPQDRIRPLRSRPRELAQSSARLDGGAGACWRRSRHRPGGRLFRKHAGRETRADRGAVVDALHRRSRGSAERPRFPAERRTHSVRRRRSAGVAVLHQSVRLGATSSGRFLAEQVLERDRRRARRSDRGRAGAGRRCRRGEPARHRRPQQPHLARGAAASARLRSSNIRHAATTRAIGSRPKSARCG